MKLMLTLLVVFVACPGLRNDLTINLKNNTTTEQNAKTQLERIQSTYDIASWLFTKEISIDEKEFIPFSHPVLTLNGRYLENDLFQMSTLLHEEFHWTENNHAKEFAGAIQEFEKLYPDAPAGGRAGARDKYSTYLHLVICDLELRLMMSLVGEAKAKSITGQWKHYQWIYEKVLNDPAIHKTNVKFGLTIENLSIK